MTPTEASIIRDARIVFAAKSHARLRHAGKLAAVPCTRACPEAFTLPAETVLAVWDATPGLVGGSLATKLGDEVRRLRLEARAHALKASAVEARAKGIARVIAARRTPTRVGVAPPAPYIGSRLAPTDLVRVAINPDAGQPKPCDRVCLGCGQPFDLVCDCED